MTHVMAPDERRRRLASGADLHASERYDGAQPCSDLNIKIKSIVICSWQIMVMVWSVDTGDLNRCVYLL